jgi:predicted nucleic acid-binding protein
LPEFICNTSPFQYLHQIGQLDLLHALTKGVVVPPAVVAELDAGRSLGFDVPDLRSLRWVTLRTPASAPALPLAADLGKGESAVLALALEASDPLVILDDGLGRRAAELLRIPFTGTLGILLDAKKAGMITAITPMLNHLDSLRFRLSAATRAAVMRIAGEHGGDSFTEGV